MIFTEAATSSARDRAHFHGTDDPRPAQARATASDCLGDGRCVSPARQQISLCLNSVLGLPPVAGDALLGAISLYIVYEGYRLGAPKAAIAAMLANVEVETAVGAIPIAGDLFDVAFKANLRNLEIIDRYVTGRA